MTSINNTIICNESTTTTLRNSSIVTAGNNNWFYICKINNTNPQVISERGYIDIEVINGTNTKTEFSVRLLASTGNSNLIASHNIKGYSNISSSLVGTYSLFYIYKENTSDNYHLFLLVPSNSICNLIYHFNYIGYNLIDEGTGISPDGSSSGYTNTWALSYTTDINGTAVRNFGTLGATRLFFSDVNTLSSLSCGIGISNTTNAISTTNGGTFTTAGGMGISGDAYIGGNSYITGLTSLSSILISGSITSLGGIGINLTTDATSSLNGGALTNAGGGAIAKKIYIGEFINVGSTTTTSSIININDTITTTSSNTGCLVLSGGLTISNSTDATSATNGGSLTIGGGIGIAKKIIINGNTTFGNGVITSSTITSTNTTTSVSSITGAFKISGSICISDTTDSTSSTNGGTITTAGGCGIAKRLFVGLNIYSSKLILGTGGSGTTSYFRLGNNPSGISLNNSGGTESITLGISSASPSSLRLGMTPSTTTTMFNFMSSNTNILTLTGNGSLTFIPRNFSGTPSSNGVIFNLSSSVFNDSATAASGTITNNIMYSFNISGTINATSTNVTTTNATTVYIAGAPIAGTNQIITNAYSLHIASGLSLFDDPTSTIRSALTTATTSLISGGVLLSGGIAINNTTDATSNTSGGTVVLGGGAAVGKSIFLTNLRYTSPSVITLNSSTSGNTYLTCSNASINSSGLSFFTTTGNNTNNNNIYIYGKGVPSSITNTECMSYGFDASNVRYFLNTQSTGTGTVRSLSIYTDNNIDQLLLNTDGTVTISNTTATTSSIIGSLKLSGGISIDNTTDAVSSINGGSATFSGGLAIAKKLYSNALFINNIDYTPNTGDNIQDIVTTLSNNISIPTNITGFSVSNTTAYAFNAFIGIRTITSETFGTVKIVGVYDGGIWSITTTITSGTAQGVTFSITSAGQMQYTTTNTNTRNIRIRYTTISAL